MNKGKPTVDYTKCMACGVCVQACPFSCLDLIDTTRDKYKKAYPELTEKDRCTGCKLCEKQCPLACIMVA